MYTDMPCPTSTDSFDIVCNNPADPNDTTYTITATGNGNVAGFVYTIDQANLRTTAGPWGSGNCWITRKGNGC
jgi:type IV pilus assembly protein PilE